MKRTTLNLALIAVLFGLQPDLVAASTSLEQRVERLERVTDNPVILQQAQQLERQQQEIQSLYDQIERFAHRLSQLEAKVERQNEQTDERLANLEEKDRGSSAAFANTAQPDLVVEAETDKAVESVISQVEASKAVEVAKPTASADPKKDYDDAFNLLKASKFDESIVAFNNFVTANPDHALTANGYYWLGESYLMKQNYADAYDAFDKVLQDFSDSSKTNDSLLRAADSLVGLNRLDEAKKMYQQLVKIAPTTPSGKTAQRRLDSFNK